MVLLKRKVAITNRLFCSGKIHLKRARTQFRSIKGWPFAIARLPFYDPRAANLFEQPFDIVILQPGLGWLKVFRRTIQGGDRRRQRRWSGLILMTENYTGWVLDLQRWPFFFRSRSEITRSFVPGLVHYHLVPRTNRTNGDKQRCQTGIRSSLSHSCLLRRTTLRGGTSKVTTHAENRDREARAERN